MQRLGKILAGVNQWFLIVVAWTALCRPAWAAPPAETAVDNSGGGPFVLGYFLAFVLIALGLFVVCRPSPRASWTPKRIPQEEES